MPWTARVSRVASRLRYAALGSSGATAGPVAKRSSVAEVVASHRPRTWKTHQLSFAHQVDAVEPCVAIRGRIADRVARGSKLLQANASLARGALDLTLTARNADLGLERRRCVTRQPEAI